MKDNNKYKHHLRKLPVREIMSRQVNFDFDDGDLKDGRKKKNKI